MIIDTNTSVFFGPGECEEDDEEKLRVEDTEQEPTANESSRCCAATHALREDCDGSKLGPTAELIQLEEWHCCICPLTNELRQAWGL